MYLLFLGVQIEISGFSGYPIDNWGILGKFTVPWEDGVVQTNPA